MIAVNDGLERIMKGIGDPSVQQARSAAGNAGALPHRRQLPELFAPAGEFTLQPSDKPLVLISGGVGIAPTLAMLEER